MPAAPFSGTPTRKSGLRQFARIALITLAALVVLYFVVTSGAFLKAVVIPRVGQAMHAQLTVESISLSPFSKLQLRQVKLQTTGDEPVFQAEEVLVRYSLFALISGNLAFPQITIATPTVNVTQQADGKTNLDPLLQGETNAVPTTAAPRTPQLDIRKIDLSRGTIRFTRIAPDGSRQRSEIFDLNVLVTNLANGAAGRVELESRLTQTMQPAAGSTNKPDSLEVRLSGAFDLSLEKDLLPSAVKGDLRLNVAQGAGQFQDLAGLSGTLTCDSSPTEIRDLTLRFDKGGQRLGTIRLNGPIDLPRSEARLKLEIAAIDRNVLNLAGAPLGLDFADTSLSASSTVDVSRRGEVIAATGKVNAERFTVRQGPTASPPLDLQLDYQFQANLGDESAVVHRLAFSAKQTKGDLLSATLDRPMNLSWGKTEHGLNESSIRLTLTNLHLGDWRMFLPTNAPSGTINAQCRLLCQRDGKRFTADLGLNVQDLVTQAGPYPIRQGDAKLQATAVFTDFRSLLVEQYQLSASEGGIQLFTASGSAGYDLLSGGANLQLALESELPKVLQPFPVPELQATSGRISLDALYNHETIQTNLTVNVTLAGFNGSYGSYRFNNYEARAGVDAELTEKQINLRRASLMARQGSDPFGSVDLSGKYDRVLEIGDLRLNVENLTQSGLQPILAPVLAPKNLVSVTLKAKGTLRVEPKATSTATLDLDLSRLVIIDPDRVIPPTPFDLQLLAEATYRSNQVDVSKFTLGLPPTTRARNKLELQGKANFARTNAIVVDLKLASDSLDLTSLYDVFMTNQPPARAGTAQAKPAATPGPETEPPAIQLPLQRLDASLKIDSLYLHDLFVSNWVASARYDQGQLAIQPVKLLVNGGAVTSHTTLDLSKPGYTYDLNVKADKVPIGPFVTSFAPDYQDQLKGDLNASLAVKGAGITMPNLQKNLAATFDFSSTNLNLSIASIRTSSLRSVINVIVSIPDLIRNPAAAVGNLLSKLAGGQKSQSQGWLDEFAQSPIDTIILRGNNNAGRTELQQATVSSAAFIADARGTITLAPILTNSPIQIPVSVSLRRSLAEKAGLAAGAATNVAYVKLPDFLTMKGTLGDPKPEINHLALIAVTAKAGSGLIGNTGNAGIDNAANLLNTVGNLLGGQGATPAAATPGATTAAPAPTLTNAVRSLLPTNVVQPRGAATNQTTNTQPVNLLDLFKKRN